MQLHFNISYLIPVYFPLIPFENEISGLDTPPMWALSCLWQTKMTNYHKWFLNLANTTTYVWSYTFFINVIQTKVRHSSFSQTIETCSPPPSKNACLSNNPPGCSKYKNSSILTLKLISRKIRKCVPTSLRDYFLKKAIRELSLSACYAAVAFRKLKAKHIRPLATETQETRVMSFYSTEVTGCSTK